MDFLIALYLQFLFPVITFHYPNKTLLSHYSLIIEVILYMQLPCLMFNTKTNSMGAFHRGQLDNEVKCPYVEMLSGNLLDEGSKQGGKLEYLIWYKMIFWKVVY